MKAREQDVILSRNINDVAKVIYIAIVDSAYSYLGILKTVKIT